MLNVHYQKELLILFLKFVLTDTADYKLEGISQEFRGMISHLVMHAVNNRIDIHIENINCHPMEIRRYYRRLDY